MKFRDIFSFRQIIMSVLVLAFFITLGLWDSATQVDVTFRDASVYVKADKYQLDIPYEKITSAELTDLAEAGEEINNGADDKTLRTGYWENDTWGKHHIIADLEAENCIVIYLEDGQIFVFSQKDTETTAEVYQTLRGYLDE